MPLIVLVGVPSSGKTTRAQLLKKYLEEEQKRSVVLISEESLEMRKGEFYCSPQ